MDGRLEEDSNGLKLWFLLNKYLCLESPSVFQISFLLLVTFDVMFDFVIQSNFSSSRVNKGPYYWLNK